jgi:hypothetical protein
VLFELAMGFIVIALDGGLLERSVHPFDLAVGPWMVGLGETMLDLVLSGFRREATQLFASIGAPPAVPKCGSPCGRRQPDQAHLVPHLKRAQFALKSNTLVLLDCALDPILQFAVAFRQLF